MNYFHSARKRYVPVPAVHTLQPRSAFARIRSAEECGRRPDLGNYWRGSPSAIISRKARTNRILRVPPHPLPMISFCLPQAQIQADLINSLLMGGSVSGLRDNTPCPAVVLYALSSASHIQMRARPSPVRGLSGLSKTRKRRS